MDKQVNEATEQVGSVEDAEMHDLGSVSADTRGGLIGHTLDAAFGVRKP